MFGHLGRNLAPGGAGDSNPGPLGTKSRVLDHSAPGGHSPGGSAPRAITPWGITLWGIIPQGNRFLGIRLGPGYHATNSVVGLVEEGYHATLS